MTTAEIREQFLSFFEERGHSRRQSSSLVPEDDPTLLFTNAGMVQFKRIFLGQEEVSFKRAVTSQKCVRAGGKHNDLEEVGRTTRHLTFFEMLGNFSFGDYFKKDAIRFAWDLLTGAYGLEPERFYATVHHTDDETADLWTTEVGLPPERIHRLGDKDNFWQMADTGPCGPCSELHYDLRKDRTSVPNTEEFVELNNSGEISELWNLVFMQYNRAEDGKLTALPAASVDTGLGLERLASVLQGASSVYHTDLFRPMLDRVGELVGKSYDSASEDAVSYRVLADHSRAVAFLLSDGVFPANEGRGYVLRRILRRAMRHAWLLGRREPTLTGVVAAVVDSMGDTFPDLIHRREDLLKTTRVEEERFLSTIEGGMKRFDELASEGRGTIDGDEAFRLYDTFGFPIDLTEIMAEERGYDVDKVGFEEELAKQRARSRADREEAGAIFRAGDVTDGWTRIAGEEQTFVGYDRLCVETEVLAHRVKHDVVGLILRESPFYLESGGQVSDVGVISADGWKLVVTDAADVMGQTAVFGSVKGVFPDLVEEFPVEARVTEDVRRDTVRNHTATHLLHSALREVLGDHVVQRGSLVAPDRLRFDFAHTGPLGTDEVEQVESIVNKGIWADHLVEIDHRSYAAAVADGAMALFGEKYPDQVRVVSIAGVSMELCGGTHATHTGAIGLFRLVSQSGVSAGVRRIEALTGRAAFAYLKGREATLEEVSTVLKTRPGGAVRRAEQLLSDTVELENLLDQLRAQGGSGETDVTSDMIDLEGGGTSSYRGVRIRVRNADDARKWGDQFLESGTSGVAVLAAEMPGKKHVLFAFVSEDMISRGVRADALVREVSAFVGGRGGGKSHIAQAGVEDATSIEEALHAGASAVRALLRKAKA